MGDGTDIKVEVSLWGLNVMEGYLCKAAVREDFWSPNEDNHPECDIYNKPIHNFVCIWQVL